MIENLKGAITSDDVLGKDVIDIEGTFIGVSEKLYLDPTSLHVLGISVDKGFLRKGYVIGSHYIHRISDEVIFLRVLPAFRLRKRMVYDSKGVYVGKVRQVVLFQQTNSLESIIVSRRFLFSKRYSIPVNKIRTVGKLIILDVHKSALH